MTLPILTVLFAILSIIITKIPVSIAMNRQQGGYDNRYPRDQQAQLTGLGKRALSAHLNSLEALPVFIAGLFCALHFEASASLINACCILFIIGRVLYTVCYWANIHLMRSLSWGIAFVSSCAMVVAPLLN
ncbi:MAPEG family protein [Bacterioplanoides sp. SCSIO 12839]|uniref:MAPEG family protein n=1 Tax=Bacterioplanoides sp. SCSIO 12839 TaxID=2829569 RepID=UPI0021031EAF|nr:MAPEG family protein [Bacterioplanoides sp. SCSIO 12839]UTW49942.1 MAPEG family protein [Bacterioplanoides sp. SCSIO 12839]